MPWEQQCQEVAQFMQQHGRLLRTKAGKAERFLFGEKALGVWCNARSVP